MSLMVVNHDGSLRPPRAAVFYPFGFAVALALESARVWASAARCGHTLAELGFLLAAASLEKRK